MSSDEEDYMSETFLAKCIPQDSTPGLIKSHSLKRQHLIDKKVEEHRSKMKKIVPVRVLEANRREEGLQESISADNKGYALLQKMGYKPGQGIGKQKSGIAEPISITLKSDRFGLGRATVLKEISELKAKKRAKYLKKHEEECSVDDYRKRLADKAHEKEILYDLHKSQRICKTLDTKDVIEPDEPWFWPEEPKEDSEESEDEFEDIQFEPPEKLKLLTSYLRKCHLYCIWCGTQFTDPEDMDSHCPGPSRDFH